MTVANDLFLPAASAVHEPHTTSSVQEVLLILMAKVQEGGQHGGVVLAHRTQHLEGPGSIPPRPGPSVEPVWPSHSPETCTYWVIDYSKLPTGEVVQRFLYMIEAIIEEAGCEGHHGGRGT